MEDAKGKLSPSEPLSINGAKEEPTGFDFRNTPKVATLHFVVFSWRNERKYIYVLESSQRGHNLKTLEALQLKCNVVSI